MQAYDYIIFKRGADRKKKKKKKVLFLSRSILVAMTDPTQYSPDVLNEGTGLDSPLIPLDLGVDYGLGYTPFSGSDGAFTADANNNNNNTSNEEPEDMQEVLDALLDLHSLQNKDPVRFEKDYVTILKAINLNEELQNKVQDQIRLVEEQLNTNSKLLVNSIVQMSLDNVAHSMIERSKSVYTGREQMWRQLSHPYIVPRSNQLF